MQCIIYLFIVAIIISVQDYISKRAKFSTKKGTCKLYFFLIMQIGVQYINKTTSCEVGITWLLLTDCKQNNRT